jgi:hypothetical protein
MPRLRTLKPGFFTNDVLAEVAPLGRLLFAGLWCLADREGRLEDRPRKIKAELLPYDDCDVNQLLDELDTRGFILRYESGGNLFIQIVNFGKHQNPHIKEAESSIPAPTLYIEGTVQEPYEHSASTVLSVQILDPDPDPDPGVEAQAHAPRTTTIDERYVKALVKRYADVYSEDEVRDKVRDAMGHQAYKKRSDKQAYVNNWLLSDAKPIRERRKQWSGTNGNGKQSLDNIPEYHAPAWAYEDPP